MNHLAFAVHRLNHRFSDINCIIQSLEENGFDLNQDGGALKVSTDGLLLQVSSLSEKLPVEFSDGVIKSVPASYIEFTDRLVCHSSKICLTIRLKSSIDVKTLHSITRTTFWKAPVLPQMSRITLVWTNPVW